MTQLQEALFAAREAIGTPQFDFINSQIKLIRREYQEARLDVERHRARAHRA